MNFKNTNNPLIQTLFYVAVTLIGLLIAVYMYIAIPNYIGKIFETHLNCCSTLINWISKIVIMIVVLSTPIIIRPILNSRNKLGALFMLIGFATAAIAIGAAIAGGLTLGLGLVIAGGVLVALGSSLVLWDAKRKGQGNELRH